MSPVERARRAKVAQPVISACETGRREPGLAMLSKLVEASGHRLRVDLVAQDGQVRPPPDTAMGRGYVVTDGPSSTRPNGATRRDEPGIDGAG